MSSKLTDFLAEKKIDERRLVVASKRIERLTPADRQLKLQKRQAKASDSKEKLEGKPCSGRPVNARLLNAIKAGKPVSGPAKQRVLRAVNRILEQKKEEPVELRALF